MQVVGYDTGVQDLVYDPADGPTGALAPPKLYLAADGAIETISLAVGRELTYSLGDRYCAGRHDGDRHEACSANEAPYCGVHQSTWRCAQCRGHCELPLDSCNEEHAVYLAAFAPRTVKVGVTRLWRLPARLREQGADRGAHIHTVSNGRIARQLEQEIAESVPERVPIESKVASLGQPVDEDVWSAALDQHTVIDTFSFEYGLTLRDQPLRETLATGTIRGVKGRLLVLQHAGGVYAVDLRDLVGHDVRAEPTERNFQSSLGTFG